MTRVIAACCLLLMFSALVSAQSLRTRNLLNWQFSKLRSIKSLSSGDQGWGGRQDFYKLSKEFLGNGRPDDFLIMLQDRNPVVRAMGLLCLAQLDSERYPGVVLSFANDKEEVHLARGDIIYTISLGRFARELLQNPYFLEPESKMPLTGIGMDPLKRKADSRPGRWPFDNARWEIRAILPQH